MVMKKNAMRRNLRQSIVKSLGRYIAISAIIALGAGLFLGLVISKTDMVATGQMYIDNQNMFDLRMVSNYGWTEEYVEEFAALPGVEDAEGLIYMDFIAQMDSLDDSVYRFYSIPETVNRLALRGGRMPERDDECLADGFYFGDEVLGKTVTISENNEEDSLDSIKYKTFTIVGYVATPLYMDMNRGTTSIGNGSLENYFFIPDGAFDVDYFMEIDLTLSGEYAIYSKEYGEALDAAVDVLEPQAEELSRRRFQELKDEIEEEYEEGYQEYLDGLQEYEDAKAEAEQELADAEQELKDGEEELEDSRRQLVSAGNQIEAGYKELEVGQVRFANKKAEFEALKAAGQAEISAMRAKLDANAAAVEAGYNQAMAQIAAAQKAMDDAAALVDLERVAVLKSQIEALESIPESERTPEQVTAYDSCQQELAYWSEYLNAYENAGNQLNAVSNSQEIKDAITAKYTSDATYAALIEKEQELAAGEAELAANEQLLAETKRQLDGADEMLMINWGKWGEARDELAEGWIEYKDAKIEAEQELAEAEAELKDAEEDLREAREEIDSMEEPDLIILDRESNIGYNNLDSSSDIVAGISRVFPVFFLLIASLVCITTMTRMIDEERTQIGTLKALGYSSGEIISKYLIYSGSGSVIGCVLGIALGSTIFPTIIWEVYKIMLHIQPDVVLTVNIPLSVAIVVAYLSVMLLVTWYCCYKTLQEEPAQLIRPKAPDAGKKILLEYLPFWHKISFLNKVTIRNIFRYRQRLAMMLIGISGCTALLIAGYGLRDSIVNVVDFQFEEVTHYDMSVYFRDVLTEKEEKEFEKAIRGKTEDYMFYHQSSVELETEDGVKEIYMISGSEELNNFMTLKDGETSLSLPGKDEVVLSVGVAEMMKIETGDIVTLRSADLEEMELTVSGVYDNYVYNYCIVDPATVETHWGEAPELQMAFIKVSEGQDVHPVSAVITDLDTVLNVTISEDLAEMVRNMMEALDLVVIVVVFCAALLAVIVLYNLTNININERIREIATIKVLGFNASETASYVFKENMVLTVAGSLLGLVMGRFLLEFIMDQVRIDMVWFKAVLTPKSCVIAVVLTLLAAVAVEFIFYFKLEKINMAEALKSVE